MEMVSKVLVLPLRVLPVHKVLPATLAVTVSKARGLDYKVLPVHKVLLVSLVLPKVIRAFVLPLKDLLDLRVLPAV